MSAAEGRVLRAFFSETYRWAAYLWFQCVQQLMMVEFRGFFSENLPICTATCTHQHDFPDKVSQSGTERRFLKILHE